MMASMATTLSNAEYRSVNRIAKSDLDLIHKSPALLEWKKNAPREESEVAITGTALHAAVLEPEAFAAEYIKRPSFDRRTKDGKAGAEAFDATMAGSGKIILDADDYDQVTTMRDSIMAHPVAAHLLGLPGVSEASIFFEIDGLRCKARPDRLVTDEPIILDVKTTDDVEKFEASAEEYRYHVQAAWYCEALRQLRGVDHRFIFVVVGKRKVFGQHPVRVFEMEPEWLEAGKAAYLEDLAAAKELEEFGPSLHIETIHRPRWAK